ncbi:MAG: hypothetical protein KatS3mg076_2367 [Candidatus Binatia bacterium]|nr:MAG: hypothetical protein KatS3mg076_2367 [Candidatus Binatia bacterium]
MALIAGTGNYGFFNLLTVVLCLPLLDDGHLGPLVRRLPPLPELRRPPGAKSIVSQVPFAVLAVFLLVLNVVPFAHGLRFRPLWPGPLLGLYRATEPFHLANPYGLFARMTTSRPEIVLEGSNDAKTWQEYEFRWKPGDPRRAPAFVQPHMPRLDWRMWFAALGNLRTDPWFLSFCLRVLQGSRPVLGLLAENPFPDRPPRYLRATLYDYRFTTWDERRRTGAWWHRKRLRAYTPVLALDPEDPNRLLAVRTRP